MAEDGRRNDRIEEEMDICRVLGAGGAVWRPWLGIEVGLLLMLRRSLGQSEAGSRRILTRLSCEASFFRGLDLLKRAK